MRLIDADKVCEHCGDYDMCKDEYIDVCAERDLLKRCPTIDPSTLRPKGEWIERKEIFIESEGIVDAIGCTNCNKSQREYRRTPFCPNCGADMRGEENETNRR